MPDDRTKLILLWKNAFGDTDDYINMFLDFAFSHCKIAVKKVDSKIVSMLTIIPATMVLNQEKQWAAYIYAVATDNDYRGRGFSKDLMNFAKTYADSKNLSALFLVPSDNMLFDFYLKQDFKFASCNYVTVFENDCLGLTNKNCHLYSIGDDEYIRLRNQFAIHSKNFVMWSDDYLRYSALEARFCKGGVIGADINGNHYYVLYDIDKSSVFITESSIENKADLLSFLDVFCKKFDIKKCFVKTNFALSEDSIKINFGMFFSSKYNFSENDHIFLNTVLD